MPANYVVFIVKARDIEIFVKPIARLLRSKISARLGADSLTFSNESRSRWGNRLTVIESNILFKSKFYGNQIYLTLEDEWNDFKDFETP